MLFLEAAIDCLEPLEETEGVLSMTLVARNFPMGFVEGGFSDIEFKVIKKQEKITAKNLIT